MGGSKSGTVAAETPTPISTTNSIGSTLEAPTATFEETGEDVETAVEKKKLGTRGLRIPLVTDKVAGSTVSKTNGVQL